MLARDYANPVSDSHYPFSRSFDWYSGHSWAKGLYPSSDGKDQESSSEDTLASYALKMWGKVINDKNMEARGNLMLAVQKRSLQKYFLYTDDNTVEPAEFIGNKVSGIMFENKIDHTTYFGNKIEYIQGIHMLPLLPMSTLIRTAEFVQQEWDAYSFGTYVSTVQGGWRGTYLWHWKGSWLLSLSFTSQDMGKWDMSIVTSGHARRTEAWANTSFDLQGF